MAKDTKHADNTMVAKSADLAGSGHGELPPFVINRGPGPYGGRSS